MESLEYILATEKPSVMFLQETKLGRSGRIKTPSSSKFTWYELHRTEGAEKGPKGGGIALGVLNILEPSWISEGDNDTEAITVEIWLEDFPIRLVCGYGPQENDSRERKEKFWKYINEETQKATSKGAGFILQMDGNLWAGEHIVPGDTNKQNQNGKCFENYLLQNSHLSVVNALSKCTGKITRERYTTNHTERGILDFFIVCDKMLPHVDKVLIDEKGEIALTKYRGGKPVKTDHNMLKLELNLTVHKKENHNRLEMLNLRNKVCHKQFKEDTTFTDKFSKCFASEEEFDVQFKRWHKLLKKALHKNFRKIRINDSDNKKITKLHTLLEKKNDILKKKCLTPDDTDLIESIEEQISAECEERE